MNFPVVGRWENSETGEVILDQVHVAQTFWQRFRGLQLAPRLQPHQGLLLRNCRSVHTMWMRFPLDLFFLADDFSLLELRRGVAPWRIVVPKSKRIAHVIEVSSGHHPDLTEGMNTRLTSVDATIGSDAGRPVAAVADERPNVT